MKNFNLFINYTQLPLILRPLKRKKLTYFAFPFISTTFRAIVFFLDPCFFIDYL